LQVGGAERYVVDLAVALRAGGHRPTVACSVSGPLGAELEHGGVEVRPLCATLVKRRFNPAYARAMRALVCSQPFDVLHAHLYASEVAAAVAVAGSGVPLVFTEHTEGPWRGRAARVASALAYARARHVVGVSDAIHTQLRRRFRISAQRTSFVPTAIVPGARPADRHTGDSLVVGRVARLTPEKGVDVFVRAAAQLAPRFPRAHFIVVGDGPLRPELEELATSLGLDGRLQFLGERSDARELLSQFDVMAACSVSDGSPLVVLEAMAAGVPVVASAVGGIPRQFDDGREGLLVAPGDDAALAHAVGRLLADEATRRRMSAAARRRAALQFSHEALVERMLHIYAQAADAWPAPARATLLGPAVERVG
jgi:glycosyltransferase involved in cell wall biosynthesis